MGVLSLTNWLINKFLGLIIGVLNLLLPVLHLPENFINTIDSAFVFLIGLLEGASYFVPLDIFVVCYSTILIVDNFALIFRIVKWIISLIPFVGG